MSYSYLKLQRNAQNPHIGEIILSRPNKLNTMDDQFFKEIGLVFDEIMNTDDIRVVLIWAEGKMFTAGLDLKSAAGLLSGSGEGSHAVQSLIFYKHILTYHAAFKKIQSCPKPVIACVHGACIGGGVDLISWCDIRLATQDATFSIKETQIAIVADLGTLQRIGKITSNGFAKEMAFAGDAVAATRAHHFGFLNNVYDNKDTMLQEARKLASNIANNSPLVVQGTKVAVNFAMEHNTEDSLQHIALWNSAFLQSEDLVEAVSAFMSKQKPTFRNKL